MNLYENEINWGFWQKCNTYLFDSINKVAMIDEGVTADLSGLVVTVRCVDMIKTGNQWRIAKSPSVLSDGIKTFSFDLAKGLTKNQCILYSLKSYLKEKYSIDAEIIMNNTTNNEHK